MAEKDLEQKETIINNTNTNDDLPVKPKRNKKKIVSSVFMFAGIISSVVAITAVSIYFSSSKEKTRYFILDKKQDVKVLETPITTQQKKYNISLEKNIMAQDLFDLDKSIEINKPKYDYGTNTAVLYSFYNTGYNFEKEFDNKPNIGQLEANSLNNIVLDLNLKEKFLAFNKTLKKPITFHYFIQQIATMKLPISYFYKGQKNKYYFLNSKPGVAGLEIKEFFTRIHEIVKSNNNIKNSIPNDFRILILATTKEGKIQNLKFKIQIDFDILT
ncbi:hypothetical protein DMC14_000920 [Metamycoplasma phocicerebrale]|uniref:Uncharacterized protein n=1 Tax=Metamycoplasma phocicerebrale TaxID=142649 RepID=A0A3Q9V898_9BACT|nr:hypothetical protein [Metamycoplasma phocicerebrale]AZZ65355.1 hypothetical protein DMC14_000920 [Metamycoplasma phocicerebrale]